MTTTAVNIDYNSSSSSKRHVHEWIIISAREDACHENETENDKSQDEGWKRFEVLYVKVVLRSIKSFIQSDIPP